MSPEVVGILGAALLAVGGGALTWFGYRQSRGSGVKRLRAVLEGEVERDDDSPSLAQAWSQMIRAAEEVSGGSGLHAGLRERLVRAGWALRPAEFLLALAGLAVLVAGVVLVALGAVAALLAAVATPLAVLLVLSARADAYANKIDRQLPDALGQMAAAMRAGHSLLQALQSVAGQAPAPLGGELSRVINETRVGRPLDEALLALGERVGSLDLRWSVRAMLIQRRTGGKLADILEVLAEFMRDREEVRREVRALTADGRVSAIVLLALPFVVLAAILVLRPGYLTPLITEPAGRLMSLAAAGGMVLAWLLIRRIVKVEV